LQDSSAFFDKYQKELRNHNNKVIKQGMGPIAMNKRDNELNKLDANVVVLLNKIRIMEEELEMKSIRLYLLKPQVGRDREYNSQRENSKAEIGFLQDKVYKAKQDLLMKNLYAKMESLGARTQFTSGQEYGGQSYHQYQSNTTTNHQRHNRRDLSPKRRYDDEAKETSQEDLANEEYWADQANMVEENQHDWQEAEYVPSSLPDEWPVSENEQVLPPPLVKPEPVLLKPTEPVKIQPVKEPVLPKPMEPNVDNSNLNTSTDSDQKGDTTTLSPVSRQLNIAMNQMSVDNEVKVVLSKEDKQCKFCHKDLSRDNISVLECGHCLHFMCACRYYGKVNIIEGREKMCCECFVCGQLQKESPLGLRDSHKIIGDELLNQVFGPPLPRRLTLIKN